MIQESRSCAICANDYTVQARKRVQCPYCQHECCAQCVKRYILSIRDDPCCMNCKHGWNKDFIDEQLTRNFLSGEYKRHREEVLLERESSFFQETVGLMERNKEQTDHCQTKIKELAAERRELQRRISETSRSIQNYRNTLAHLELDATHTVSDIRTPFEKKTTYIRTCLADGCKGYINQRGNCGLCGLIMCTQCHEIKSQDENAEEHQCRQENVDSVAQIKKETRTCPQCHVNIYRIDGCRQMWCTQCHTAFDWRTGNIIRERIHNPHLYEWEMQQQQQSSTSSGNDAGGAGVGACRDNELPPLSILRAFTQNHNTSVLIKRRLFDVHRNTQHILDIEIPRIEVHDTRNHGSGELFYRNIKLRVQYLRSFLARDDFKNQLVLRENRIQKNRNFQQILEMVSQACISFFHELLRVVGEEEKENEMNSPRAREINFLKKVDTLVTYTNTQLSAHTKRFKIRGYVLSPTLEIARS